MNNKQYIRTLLIPVIFIITLWVTLFSWVSPLHEFPLNDDWSYSYTVKVLLEQGRYELTNWIAGPQVTQTLWGYVFCLPNGFSFSALKLSTLTIGVIGLIFSYLLLFRFTKKAYVALFATLLIGLNPLFFSLSATFMTDIHFYSWFIISLYYFMLHNNKGGIIYWLLGTAFSLFAILTRQFGIVLPVAFMLLYFIKSFKTYYVQIAQYLGSTIFIFGIYLIYTHWIEINGQLPEFYRKLSDIFDISFTDFAFRIYIRMGHIVTGLGLWLLPISIPVFIKELPSIKRNFKIILPALLVFIFPMMRIFSIFPSGNIVNNTYLGPLTTFDNYIIDVSNTLFANNGLWLFLRPIAFIGGLILVLLVSYRIIIAIRLIKLLRSKNNDKLISIQEIAIITSFIYIGILMINYTYFDRYLIPLIFLFILIIYNNNELKLKPVIILIIGIGLFSVVKTKNYIIRNKIKWELANKAINNGIQPSIIDGGHEYNGWHGDKIDYNGKWDCSQKEYAITYTIIDGYKVVDKVNYKPLFKKHTQYIYLLKKNHLITK